ncbi:hypothetical protein JOF42_000368 [Microbacterium phyllosphaerae]|uniref:Uncharacterized protein n=1 Tax=Microbacterium phyllosphaerae TaxID=124798 RepID=A0ABS4WKZ5_9MICO|nr:hypothetical protein [Microbacterium phyllosphaerae]MBP2376873.1 hypothetical protein [Microbacterium phyllosphaerae]
MKKFLIAIVLIGLALAASPATASATITPLHPDVQYALDEVPGGVALSATHAVWPALGMTVTAESPFARSVGTCATGTYCAYAGTALTGTKLTFAICTNVSTAGLRSVGSIANGRSSGKVQARDSAGTVLGTAFPNGSATVGSGTVGLLCTL